MNAAAAVSVVEPLAERDEKVHRVLELEGFLLAQDALVALSLDKLHTDESILTVVAEVVDGDDIGMIQSRGGSRFIEQLLARVSVLGVRFSQYFV